MAHVANNSGNNEWYTPRLYLDAARRAMGQIDCDPASSAIANRAVGAARYYTKEDDGLIQTWHGNVWLNPPYAQPLIRLFCEAAVGKFQSGEIEQAVVLANNGTETKWGQTLLGAASAACFPRSRIRFLDPDGNPGAPLQGQMIVYLGAYPQRFGEAFAAFGMIAYPVGRVSA
jgi:ParB family chromosome partitioning protein